LRAKYTPSPDSGHTAEVHPARTPALSVVAAVVDALQARGAVAAVGGSGLLAALGLVDSVRDWDVTTDAETQTVEAALVGVAGCAVAAAPVGEPGYATGPASLCRATTMKLRPGGVRAARP